MIKWKAIRPSTFSSFKDYMSMKKLSGYLVVCMALLCLSGVKADVFFSDSFDRTDNTDIDASSTGMSGTLSPLAYQEVWEGSGDPTSIQIVSNQLNVAVGSGMSSLFLDHNFIDTAILTADGFSVSLDVVSINTADDPANRFGGFGVGNTLAEAQAAQDSFDSLVPFRPNTARAGTGIGVSDFYADLALDGSLRLWSNGNLLNTISVGAASGTITVNFYMSDFNAGSPVTAIVYFNGIQTDIQSFTWDNTNANYIGISGRTAGAGVLLDNLEIGDITQEAANIFLTLTDGSIIVKEGQYTDEITLSITSNPLSYPVTIDMADNLDPDQVTVTPSQVVFDSSNWMNAQTVTVTAIDDDDMERATHDTALSITVSADPASPYYGYTIADIDVLIEDNDCGTWGFNRADFNLDCQVNLEDLAYFIQEWIECSLPDPECQDFRP